IAEGVICSRLVKLRSDPERSTTPAGNRTPKPSAWPDARKETIRMTPWSSRGVFYTDKIGVQMFLSIVLPFSPCFSTTAGCVTRLARLRTPGSRNVEYRTCHDHE